MIRGVSYDPDVDLSPSPNSDTVDLLRATNVQDGQLTLQDVRHVHRRRVRAEQYLRDEDVLICSANGSKRLVGKAAQVQGTETGSLTFGAFMMTFRPDPREAVPDFMAQHFHTKAYRDWVELLLAGSSINNLRPTDLADFTIQLPSTSEQERIVDVLTDSHQLIAVLERLRFKKKVITRGMMQQILTGRTRLPGFTRPWVEIEIGELLEFKNGLNKGKEFFGRGTPIVNFMDVMRGPIIHRSDVGGRVALSHDEVRRFSARANDLFFTRTSESVEEVGTTAVLVDVVTDACFSGFILRGRPRSTEIDSRFLARAFQLAAVRRQVTSSATYTTRALTNGRSLSRVMVNLPSLEEQRAIADLIDDADSEVEALGSRLNKARRMKRGMAQELLTGRTRLTDTEVAV